MLQRNGLRAGEAERALPCDAILPHASIVMDRATTLPAPPEVVWPWLTQLGKDRAGWYFPRWVERVIPPGHRGARRLLPDHPGLAVGDRVLDWGPERPTLDAVIVDEPSDIGFRSTRGRTEITWELNLRPDGDSHTRLHLRLRIDRRRDWLTPVIRYAGGAFDWLTVVGLFAGLRERVS
jgi:hypothetical protein